MSNGERSDEEVLKILEKAAKKPEPKAPESDDERIIPIKIVKENTKLKGKTTPDVITPDESKKS